MNYIMQERENESRVPAPVPARRAEKTAQPLLWAALGCSVLALCLSIGALTVSLPKDEPEPVPAPPEAVEAWAPEEYITYKETREILEYEYTRDETYEGPDNIHEMIVQSDYFQIKMKPKSFLDLLRYYMNIKNMEAPQIYGSINLSRQSFSDIYGGKKMPKKDTMIRIAVQLNLSFDELMEFLEKAGYSLSDDKPKDRFVKEFFSLSERDIDLYNDLRIERGFGEI